MKEEEIENIDPPEAQSVEPNETVSEPASESASEPKKRDEFVDEEPEPEESEDNANPLNSFYNQGSGDNHYTFNSGENRGLPTELKLIELKTLKFELLGEAEDCVSILRNESFLVINCAHKGIANALRQFIAQNLIFETYLKQKASLDTFGSENSDIIHLIDNCKKRNLVKKENKLLLFIHDSKGNKTPTLLKKLCGKTEEGKAEIVERLGERFYIVYFTYFSNPSYLDESSFRFHQIDALGIYARTFNFSVEFLHLIQKQRNEGIWSNEDGVLLSDLDKIVSDPDFKNIVMSRGEVVIDFLEILADDSQIIESHILLVAALFPKLSPDTFRDYVSILISEKKKVVLKKKKVCLVKTWDEKTDILLDRCGLETYRQDNQMFIDFSSSVEASKCERILFRKFANFVDQQARLLIDRQQLFASNASVELHQKIHPIIAKLTAFSKEYYGDALLNKWLSELEIQRKRVLALTNELNDLRITRRNIQKLSQKLYKMRFQEDYLQQLKQLVPIKFEQQYNEMLSEHQLSKFLFFSEEQLPDNASISGILDELQHIRNTLLERTALVNSEKNSANYSFHKNVYLFGELLVSIHEEDPTREIIVPFFEKTFTVIYHRYVLLEVLNRFQLIHEVSGFFDYYKACLEHRTAEVRKNASLAFIGFLLNDTLHFYSSLERLNTWFPNTTQEDAEFTDLEKQALSILYNSLLVFAQNDQKDFEQGSFIETNTYVALFEDLSQMKAHFPFVISTLFGSIVFFKELFILEGFNPEFTIETIQIRCAMLLEYWYDLLRNIQLQDSSITLVDPKIQLLAATVQGELNKKQSKKLMRALKEKRSFYNREISRSEDLKRKTKTKKKRSHLIELINLLNT